LSHDYEIKDIALAPEGERKIRWAEAHMPVLNLLHKEFDKEQPLKGHTVVMCLHLEAKTAYLAEVVLAGGAEVIMCASNPLSTQDDVVAAMANKGINAFAVHGCTDEEYHKFLHRALDFMPDLIVDDGGDLTTLLHTGRSSQAERVIGGCEETTTGIKRIRSLAENNLLKFPMIAVNDAFSKHLFDNRYGTGQSVWDGINRATNLVVAGKTAVVIGYGWCGKGVAARARGLGARVIVCEVDAIKANEALMDGHEVMPLEEAAARGDYFITVTGNCSVIKGTHFDKMKDGAVLANAGHFDVEISIPDLETITVKKNEVRPNVDEFTLTDGRRLYLLGQGRLVNLAAGDGHPVEIMDMSFALQARCVQYLAENGTALGAGLYPVPLEIDRGVAQTRLQALGVQIDTLDDKQKVYLKSWE